MDSRDEKLTLENVDEQIELHLSQPEAFQPSTTTMTSLVSTIRDLQRIYEEDERLEHAWTRISSRVSALNVDNAIKQEEALPAIQSVQEEKKAKQDADGGSCRSILRRPDKQLWWPFRRKRYNMGIGLIAAIMLISLFAWPILSYAFHIARTAGTQPSTKTITAQHQPTVNVSSMKEYASQYFNLQYPANWVITNVTTGGPYQQTVQFRPSTTSSVFVNVNVMPSNDYSNEQLLHMDSDAKLGTMLNTSSITYHSIPWAVGVIELVGSTHTPASKLEIAYANQGTPYRIEFGATSDMFSSYTQIFNAMFASFYPQTKPTVTSTVIPTTTPTPITTPSPTIMPSPTANIPDVKVYSSLYFTIQYPSDWVVTSVTTGGTYQQTVQFQPSATSSVFVNVNIMYSNALSSNLLLLTDTDVKLGTLLSTSSVTYHGIPWAVGIVNLLGSLQTQPSKEEIAYSNQNAPYKIKFSAPPDMFSSYTKVFNSMFASFNPTS